MNAAARIADRVADLLRCHVCAAPLDIRETSARCANDHVLPWRDGYLDASSAVTDPAQARTLDSFGYEWTTFDAERPEDEAFWQRYVADLDLSELDGRVGADIGCGKARYTRYTARHLRALVALDGSDAVTAAVHHLRDSPGTVVVRAQIDAMPLAPASFGFVSCLGVLHHLPDPRAGFERVAELLAPGGLLLVYLYSRPAGRGLRRAALAAATAARRVTVQLPFGLLRGLCAPLSALLYATFVLPARVPGLRGLPLAFYRGRPVRSLWLDTFDRLSAPIENRYTWKELEPWFTAAGLRVEHVREESGLFIVARRPRP
ncbi:class I SAM-dependent methyltransferase [Dactylosporangium sp. NPDC051541]|uniref:class I SAM-dependent methyltransferase n=1 Tax=Dactylosporangium sp. NPDC051541 TaxID=3363977 RepID=UPI0037B3A23F